MTVERKVDENGAITEIITLTEEEKAAVNTAREIVSERYKQLGKKNIWNMHSGANSVSAVLKKCFTGRKQQQSAKEKAVPRAGTADGDSYGGYHFMPYGLFLNMILTYDYAEIKEIISATEEKQKIS